MRILICGGRNYDDWDRVRQEVNRACGMSIPVIIQGGAKGADFLGRVYAKHYGLQMEEYPADWNKYGKVAGIMRNQRMLNEGKPDLVIAFPGGSGTADMVRRASKQGVPVIEIN